MVFPFIHHVPIVFLWFCHLLTIFPWFSIGQQTPHGHSSPLHPAWLQRPRRAASGDASPPAEVPVGRWGRK